MHVTLPAALLVCVVASAQTHWPDADWMRAGPEQLGLSTPNLNQARDFALKGEGSGMLIRRGQLAYSWGDLERKYDLKSTSKSIGVTALALAIGDGKLSLDTKASECVPGFGAPPAQNRLKGGWLLEATLFHLATQTAGFEKPGGYGHIFFKPGTRWSYSDGGPNWLADCITLTYGQDVQALLFERALSPIGITPDDLHWRDNQYRTHELAGVARREFGSGVHANVNAMARIGLLYLREGRWKDEQLIPAEFVSKARRPIEGIVGLPVEAAELYPEASNHYGLLWWNNADGTIKGVPRDAYWSWGLYDSLIVVIPSLDMVVARAGKSMNEGGRRGSDYSKIAPFLNPIVVATGAPYPPSSMTLTWAPKETIVRKAEGGDNWPMTWGDDDAQYTAYGDGWGFEPKIEPKLSLGLARVTGGPANFEGINIRSETGEQIGQGPKGKKASGILMVDGVLYLWARNADNSQLAWSADHGETWEWADWKFKISFGSPSFLNFGKDYAGARDEYVYVYSPDSESAYLAADRLVLARVHKARIREREAYQFYRDGDWTADIDRRTSVMSNPGRVYRSIVSFNAGLERYLLCQILPGDDTRFEGGFGVYEAPEPWGPWSTVFHTEKWDVGPGETCSFPTKWMSEDGKTIHMVFSGDDYFAVRKAELDRR